MSIKSINESFNKLIEKEMVTTDSQSSLEKNMLTVIDSMEHSGQTNLKAYEYALQDAIEKEFPGKSWWEVTSVNIFWDLFNNRDPRLTAQNIINDIEGNSTEKDYKDTHNEAINEALDENPIIDWLGEHEQAWEDFTAHFSGSDIEELSDEEIIDWISDHDQLYADFKAKFNYLDESIREDLGNDFEDRLKALFGKADKEEEFEGYFVSNSPICIKGSAQGENGEPITGVTFYSDSSSGYLIPEMDGASLYIAAPDYYYKDGKYYGDTLMFFKDLKDEEIKSIFNKLSSEAIRVKDATYAGDLRRKNESKSIKGSKSVIDFVDEIEANKNNPEKCDATYREAEKTLGKYDMNYVTDVYSKHRKVESKSLKESPIYDMTPQHDARKSFYGKAKVDDSNGELTLYSYNVPVAKISNGQVTLLDKWDWSQTTLRHVKEFLKQNGFEATTVSQMRNTYR